MQEHIPLPSSILSGCRLRSTFIDVRIWGTGTGRTDGDVVTIDSETNQLSMNVSDEEIAARLKKWKAPRLKVNRGTLAKYVHLVGDASHGVCFSPASLFLYLFIFYFISFRPYIIDTMRMIFLFLSQPYSPLLQRGVRRFKVPLNVERTNHSYAQLLPLI